MIFNENINSIYVVSDLHLKTDNRNSINNFLKILENINPSKTIIVLLGDLFELWHAFDKRLTQSQLTVLKKIEEFKKKGLVIFIVGNKDLFFSNKRLNQRVTTNEKYFSVVKVDKIIIRFLNWKIFFTHGDLVDKNDKFYRLFYRIINNYIVKKLIYFIPNKTLNNIIGIVNKKYLKIEKKVYYLKEKIWQDWNEYQKSEYDVNLIIIGHFHPKKIIKYSSKNLNLDALVLPAWFENNQYLKIDKDGYSMVEVN